MRILAIDTSQGHCSAALLDGATCTQQLVMAQRRHGELILGMLGTLLDEAQLDAAKLDALAFAQGPGSFTGLRIAAAVIQGVALALDKPVVGVSTLAALAQGQRRRTGASQVLCALDARMEEVYFGAYRADEQGLMRPLCDDVVAAPDAVAPPQAGNWEVAGGGWQAYTAALTRACGVTPSVETADEPCEAQDVALLAADAFSQGKSYAAEYAVPVYLRDRVTHCGG